MPFTPFHLGFGALVKSAAPARFSFFAFATAQVLMDLEPGYKMLTQSDSDLHVITHNSPGAILIALATVLVCLALKRWSPQRYRVQIPKVSLPILMISALIGTLSHVFLDGLYHFDLHMVQYGMADRFALASLSGTESLCLIMLVVAMVIWGFQHLFNIFHKTNS